MRSAAGLRIATMLMAAVLTGAAGPAPAGVPGRSPKERAADLARAAVVLQLDDVQEEFVLSRDGRFLAVRVADGTLKLYDLSTKPPGSIRPPKIGEISAAFTADGRGVWLGTTSGRAWLFNLPNADAARSVRRATGLRLEQVVLSPDGGMLGWYDRKARVAGFFDLRTQQPITSWKDVTWGGFGRQHVAFTPDGRRFVFHADGDRGFLSGRLVLWNIAERKAEASLDVYVTDRTPGYAFAGGALYYGTRESGPYQIRRWDLASGRETVIDPNARNLHFIDLFASPSGRYLAEGDFEDEGVRIYDLQQNYKARTFGERFANVVVGWDPVLDLVLVTARRLKGVDVWDPRSGERLATVRALAGRQVERVEMSADGRRLVASWWTSRGPNTPVRFHVTVFRIDGRR